MVLKEDYYDLDLVQKTYTIRYLERYIVSNNKKGDIFAKAIIRYIYRFYIIAK